MVERATAAMLRYLERLQSTTVVKMVDFSYKPIVSH